jgi:hypothetical protein
MRSMLISILANSVLIGSAALLASQPLASHAQGLRKTAAAQAACGPQDTTFHVDPLHTPDPPPSDPRKAVLYIIQSGGFTSKLGLDGQWIGAVTGNSYTATTVTAGEHHLCVAWQSHEKWLSEKVALHGLNAVAGQTYYFTTQDVSQGGNAYEISFRPADLDEAKMLLEGYRQVKATTNK